MTHSPPNLIEHEAIIHVLQKYIDGARSGRGDEMRPAFHPGATIFGYMGDELVSGPIEHLFEWIDANEPAATLQAQFGHIDVEDTVATVRLELDDWTGYRFTDLFTLVKFEGEWKITNKIFHLHS